MAGTFVAGVAIGGVKYVRVTDLVAHLELEQAGVMKELAEIKALGKGNTYIGGLAQGMVSANHAIVSALQELTQEN